MLKYDSSRIMFDFDSTSNGTGLHTIFCIDIESKKHVLHRSITRYPGIIDRENDNDRYKCKIIGVDNYEF